LSPAKIVSPTLASVIDLSQVTTYQISHSLSIPLELYFGAKNHTSIASILAPEFTNSNLSHFFIVPENNFKYITTHL